MSGAAQQPESAEAFAERWPAWSPHHAALYLKDLRAHDASVAAAALEEALAHLNAELERRLQDGVLEDETCWGYSDAIKALEERAAATRTEHQQPQGGLGGPKPLRHLPQRQPDDARG